MIVWVDTETTGLREREGHLLEVAIVVTDDNLQEVAAISTVVRPVGDTPIDTIPMDRVVRDMHEKNGLFAELRAGGGMARHEAEEKLIEFLTIPPPPPTAQPQVLYRGELVLAPYQATGVWGALAGNVELDYCKNCKKKCAEHVLEDYCPASSLPDVVVRWSPKVVTLASQTPLAGSTIGFDRNWLKEHMPKLQGLFSYRSVDVSSIAELARRWAPEIYDARPKAEGGAAHRALADIRESINYLRYFKRVGFVDGASKEKLSAVEDAALGVFDDMVGHKDYSPYEQRAIPVSDSHVSSLAVALFSVEPHTDSSLRSEFAGLWLSPEEAKILCSFGFVSYGKEDVAKEAFFKKLRKYAVGTTSPAPVEGIFDRVYSWWWNLSPAKRPYSGFTVEDAWRWSFGEAERQPPHSDLMHVGHALKKMGFHKVRGSATPEWRYHATESLLSIEQQADALSAADTARLGPMQGDPVTPLCDKCSEAAIALDWPADGPTPRCVQHRTSEAG